MRLVISYVIAGLVVGAIVAMSAASLITTYTSTGVLNFAYGAEAYFVARTFYYLHTQQNWNLALAALVSIVLVGPAMGILLWAILFRFLPGQSSIVKIVAAIGLSVAIPPIAQTLYGHPSIGTVPGLAPEPVKVFHLGSVALTLDEVVVLITAVVLAVAIAFILMRTQVGLVVRATVDSPALASLVGSNPVPISVGVWTVTTFIAGLSGVLVAPINGLAPETFTALLSSAFAVMIIARLRVIWVAVIGALLLGAAQGVLQYLVPAGSYWASASVNALPFAIVVIAFGYFIITGKGRESASVGGPLDRAIQVTHREQQLAKTPALSGIMAHVESGPAALSEHLRRFTLSGGLRVTVATVLIVALCVIPILLDTYWVGLIGQGLAFAIAFLSYRAVAGEAGMIWLCEITFAGIAAIIAAELAQSIPILLAILVAALVVAVLGAITCLIMARQGDLYIALATLTFGVLVDNLVFPINRFYNYGQGISVYAPAFAQSSTVLCYLTLGVLLLALMVITAIRRSTIGAMLAALRGGEWSVPSIGINVVALKVSMSAIGAFFAGIGGGFLALYSLTALGTNFATSTGLLWLAVIFANGIGSTISVVVAGLALSIIPAIFVTYLPVSLANLPTALFGLGAILIVKNPNGAVPRLASDFEALVLKAVGRRAGAEEALPALNEELDESGHEFLHE